MKAAIALLSAVVLAMEAHATNMTVSATWIGGSDQFFVAAVYDTTGVASTIATPGSRSSFCYAMSTADTDQFYVYGGDSGGATQGDFWSYQLSTARWTVLSLNVAFNRGTKPGSVAYPGSLRFHRCEFSPSDGYLYLYGGSPPSAAPSNLLWRYSTTLKQWTVLTPSTASPNGYSIGLGQEDVANFPSARSLLVMAAHPFQPWIIVMGGQGYTLNGNTVAARLNDLWRYNTLTGMWTWLSGDIADGNKQAVYGTVGVPAPSNVPAGAASRTGTMNPLDGTLFVFGGADANSGNTDSTWKYDFNTNQWTWLSGMVSFQDNQPILSDTYIFNGNNTPGGRSGMPFNWIPDTTYIVAFGGNGPITYNVTGQSASNDLWLYDTAINQWAWLAGGQDLNINGSYGIKNVTSNSSYPPTRSGHLGIVMDSSAGYAKLILFGGVFSIQQNKRYNDIWRIDLDWQGVSVTTDVPTVSSAVTKSSTTLPLTQSSKTTSTIVSQTRTQTTSTSKVVVPTQAAASSTAISGTNVILFAIAAVLAIIFVIACIATMIISRRRRQGKNDTKQANGSSIDIALNDALETLNGDVVNATQMADSTVVSNSTEFAMPGFLQYKAGIHFRWTKQIAKGGGGAVYLGESLHAQLAPIGQQIVVKIVGGTREDVSALMSQAFDQEISVMHYLGRQRNIAGLLGWCDAPVAMLMKYYAHGALDSYLNKNRILSKGLKIYLLSDIAKGLHFMHSRGVAHCDMKTANILVDQDDLGQLFCVLTDFGIAQMFSENAQLVHAFQVVNLRGVSIKYAAPEAIARFRNKQGTPNMQAGFAADVYSLAVIINEVLLGVNGWRK